MQRAKTSTSRAVTVLAVFLTIAILAPAAHAGEPNYAWQLFHATNDSRSSHGIKQLDRANRMSKEAEAHSRAMARSKRLWHTAGPVRYGARCYAWGENVGWTTGGSRIWRRPSWRARATASTSSIARSAAPRWAP